jgi:uncharacterized membrane-anchored protein YhcB (DUF1043 family)
MIGLIVGMIVGAIAMYCYLSHVSETDDELPAESRPADH